MTHEMDVECRMYEFLRISMLNKIIQANNTVKMLQENFFTENLFDKVDIY